MKLKKLLISVLIVFCVFSLNAQDTLRTVTIILNKELPKQFRTSKLIVEYQNESELNLKLHDFLNNLYNIGYLSARVDSFSKTKPDKVYVSLGDIYKWLQLSLVNFPEEDLNKLKLSDDYFKDKAISLSDYNKFREDILNYYENNSYPFAELSLVNIKFYDAKVSADLFLNRNNKIVIDSIHIKPYSSFNKNYLYRYIGVSPNDAYSEESVAGISNSISEIPFLNEIKPPEIEFFEENADLFVYVDKKQANRFNGILGVLPNNKTSKKLLLTGELELFMVNSIKQGESINFNWQRLESTSQNLKIDLDFPYIISSTFGVDYSFLLQKKDSSFLNVDNKFGLRFYINKANYFRMFFERKVSSLLSGNITNLANMTDLRWNMAGFGMFVRKLDYIYNPRKGYLVNASASIGQKSFFNTESNNQNSDKPTSNLAQYEFLLQANYYLPLYKHLSVRFYNSTGYLNSPVLYENEIYKIGGFSDLRGFDEESILASVYSVMNCELRYLYERNSNLFVFFNAAYYENNTHSDFISDYPIGFGIGTNFQTKAGIFSISYALGKQFDNPIEFKRAKIHFGLSNRF